MSRNQPSVLVFGPSDIADVPAALKEFVASSDMDMVLALGKQEMWWSVLRNLPQLIFLDVQAGNDTPVKEVCSLVKADPYTAVIPVVVLANEHDSDRVKAWFECGADEVLTSVFHAAEQQSRLRSLMARTRRNVGVHPTTMLPGTPDIDREIRRRIDLGEQFAVCYADLDHFKEFNDRYNYQDGDTVIYIVSRILRDVVTGIRPDDGFTGHIGGDDFIIILPVEHVPEVCNEIITTFDTLIPLQYSQQDRATGYFLGKDRRGQLHKVPIMTLSIGVVTNEVRTFDHPARVGALATEMKSYAKSLPGSVYVIDRRSDSEDQAVRSEV